MPAKSSSCIKALPMPCEGHLQWLYRPSLLPLVNPAYSAVSVEPSFTVFSSLAPAWPSKLMLHSTSGDSALPLKAVSARGATNDLTRAPK